jgi:ribosomal protein L11 methyltransferase
LASFPALDLSWRSGIEASSLEALHERLHALLDEFSPQAIHDHESADGWRVFFRTHEQRDDAARALRSSAVYDIALIAPVDVADDEWARRSQANLTPITVGRIVVTPPWHVTTDSEHIVIVIDPSTGFGTGHHETTRLCLSLLQGEDLAGRAVIDVGTGSGVLAIAAAQLGAGRVVAIDEDPQALRNARENVARNGVAACVDVREANLATFDNEPAPVVVANITAAVLQRHAARLASLVERRGVLIASGFSAAEADDVAHAFRFEIVRSQSERDWAAVVLRSPA